VANHTIEQDFREKVREQVRLVPEGDERFRVLTPFVLDDGDHLAIVLRREAGQWLLTDEGHTLMRLSYRLSDEDLEHPVAHQLLRDALATFGAENRDGELVLSVPEEHYEAALFPFVQMLLRINDLSQLAREDFDELPQAAAAMVGRGYEVLPARVLRRRVRALVSEIVPAPRRTFDWFDRAHDPGRSYVVDCRIERADRPLFIYALRSDTKVRDATIALQQFASWKLNFEPAAIFADRDAIGSGVLKRFSKLCERQFPKLEEDETQIRSYLEEAVRGSRAQETH
jgi:hypothetical protein